MARNTYIVKYDVELTNRGGQSVTRPNIIVKVQANSHEEASRYADTQLTTLIDYGIAGRVAKRNEQIQAVN